MDLSAMGNQDQMFQGNCSWCGIYGHIARDCRKKTEYLQNNQNEWMVWHGRQNQRQGQQGQRQTRQRQGQTTRQERAEKISRNGGARRQTRNTKRSRIQCGRARVGITLTIGLTQTGSSDWSTDLWTDPALEKAARQLPSTQPAQQQSNPTQGGSISMLGGFTMCELTVDDGEQQNEQDKVDRDHAMIGMADLRCGFRTR